MEHPNICILHSIYIVVVHSVYIINYTIYIYIMHSHVSVYVTQLDTEYAYTDIRIHFIQYT